MCHDRTFFAGAVIAAAMLAGCSSEDDKSPYLELRGGGFCSTTASPRPPARWSIGPLRRLPPTCGNRGEFEKSGGRHADRAPPGRRGRTRTKFDFTTPPLQGIVKDKPYARAPSASSIRTATSCSAFEKPFKSSLDQAMLPDKPSVRRPGLHAEPEAKKDSTGGLDDAFGGRPGEELAHALARHPAAVAVTKSDDQEIRCGKAEMLV
jgi:hypothetical protein